MKATPELLAALERLKDEGPISEYCGICPNVTAFYCADLAAEIDWLASACTAWPEYSGNPTFPVPHSILLPFTAYTTGKGLWDRATPYGQARWRLLDFLIERARAEVAQPEASDVE